MWMLPGANDFFDYWVDAWQRSILLVDVLRQRGNNSIEHNARKAPNVLSFDAELVLDGRSLPRPVNYGLVRIVPPKDTSIVLHAADTGTVAGARVKNGAGKRPFIAQNRGCFGFGGPERGSVSRCRGVRRGSC